MKPMMTPNPYMKKKMAGHPKEDAGALNAFMGGKKARKPRFKKQMRPKGY